MKRFVVLVCIIMSFVCAKSSILASDYAAITSNPKIADALQCLKSVGANDVIGILNGNNADRKPIRVHFRELEVYGLGNCEAITMRNKAGNIVIFINKKHAESPSEAIACLIAHESQHHTLTGSRAEEIRAWIKEVSTWNAFVRQDRTIAMSNDKLVKRMNHISKMYNAPNGHQTVEKFVANHPAYAGLN